MSINDLRLSGRPAPRNSLTLKELRDLLPEDLILTSLAHASDVELLQAQLVLERVDGDGRPAASADLGDDRLATIHASDGADERLQLRSLDGGCRFPFHNF